MTDDATYERLAELDDRLQALRARVDRLEAALNNIRITHDPGTFAGDIAREALREESTDG